MEQVPTSVFKKTYSLAKSGSLFFFMSKYPPILFILIVASIVFIIFSYYNSISNIGSLSNIKSIVATASDNVSKIYNPGRADMRKNLESYLSSLSSDKIKAKSLINFYILTANMSGLFTPSLDGVFDPSALDFVIHAGARAFILDIYSGSVESNYAPVLRVLQPGSKWIIQTINEMPLALALDTIRRKGFETGMADNRQRDPIILYFRFRGRIITSTLNLTAAAIRATLEGYRVPISENESISKQVITSFNKKVIIYSNLAGPAIQNTGFFDYCNSQAGDVKGSAPNSYSPRNIIDATPEETVEIIEKNKVTLAICAPNPEDTMSNDNNWMMNSDGVSPIDTKGINMVGLNFYSFVNGNLDLGLSKYLDISNKFQTYSFCIKPLSMQIGLVTTSDTIPNDLTPTNGFPRPTSSA